MATAAVSARMISRAQRHRAYEIFRKQQLALALGKSAFGADESRYPVPPKLADCVDRRRNRGALVAKDDDPALFASLEQGLKFDCWTDGGNRQDSALFRSFDGISVHPLKIEPGDNRVGGYHRLQRGGAHLGCLLHHVIEPRLL